MWIDRSDQLKGRVLGFYDILITINKSCVLLKKEVGDLIFLEIDYQNFKPTPLIASNLQHQSSIIQLL